MRRLFVVYRRSLSQKTERVKVLSVIPFDLVIQSYVTALFSKLKKGRITMNDRALARPHDPWLPNQMNSGLGLQLWWLFLGWVALITTTTALPSFFLSLALSFGPNINFSNSSYILDFILEFIFCRFIGYNCETNTSKTKFNYWAANWVQLKSRSIRPFAPIDSTVLCFMCSPLTPLIQCSLQNGSQLALQLSFESLSMVSAMGLKRSQ